MGYAPADNPRLLLFVMIDEPQEGHYGAAVAGPVFVKVMSAALPYLGVPPQVNSDGAAAHPAAAPSAPAAAAAMGPPAPQGVTAESVPNFIGLGLGRALDLAQQAKLRLEITGSGVVVSQEPTPHSPRRGPVCQLRLAPPPLDPRGSRVLVR